MNKNVIARNSQLRIMLLCIFSILHAILITKSKQLITKNSNKTPRSMHELMHNSCSISSYGKHGLLRNKNCACLDSTCVKSNSNTIAGDDRAIACQFNCKNCNKTICQCQSCATLRNFSKIVR